MYIRTALNHFGGSRAALAKSIGYTRQAIYAWERRGTLVPEHVAPKVARASGGRLRYDPALYHDPLPDLGSNRNDALVNGR
jgi:DNA-binding XRE family transcriptional regulator